MKKTLITLAALAASVASAAVVDADKTYTNPTGTLDGATSASNGDFTMLLVLDWDAAMGDAISNDWANRTDIINGASNSSQWGYMWQNGPTLFNGNNATTLELGIQKDGTDQAITGGDGNNISLTSANYSVVEGKLALAYTFNAGTVTVGALKSNGTTWTTATYATGWEPYQAFDTFTIGAEGVIETIMMYDSVLSTTDMADTVVAYLTPVTPDTPDTPGDAIPEPTTATLSLLALAGLAARRRRK